MAKLTATFEMKDNISSKLKGLYGSLEKVESMTQASSKAIDRLDKSKARPTLSVIDGATGKIKEIRGQIDAYGKVLAKATADVNDKASAKMDAVQKKANGISGTHAQAKVSVDDQATSAIENIEARLQGLKDLTLTISAGGAAAGGISASVGASVLETNARTAATTGMSANGVNTLVNDVYYNEKVGNSREEVATSTQNMAQQTDLSGNGLKTAVVTSNQIAELYQKDVPEVDRALGSMIKNFNMDSGRAGDNLAYVFKNAGDQYDDLLDTFNEYSSSFVDMQLAPEQVAAAFVAGTKGGARNFDDMADSMREFNLKRNEMSDDQVAAFKKVLGADETAKMFKGFQDGSYTGQEAMFRMAKGLSEIENKSQRAALATTLIGTKYEDLKQPILDMAGAVDEPAKATGELNKQYEEMLKNNPMIPINDAGREMKGIISEVGIGIMTGLVPAAEKLNTWMASTEGKAAIEDMTTSISDFVGFFSDKLVPAIQFGVDHFNVLGPAIGIGTVAIVALGTAALIVIPTIKKFGEALDFMKGLSGKGKGKGKGGLDDVTDSMSRMERKSKDGAKSVGSLSAKLKDLFKIKAPKDSPLSGGGAAIKTGRKLGKLGGLAKGAGRLLLPAGIALGAYDIFTSSAGKERNQAIGGAIGGIGGGMAGAAAGAAMGSIVPGIGTAIGGLVGGAAGYFGGDKLGSWLGGMFGGGDEKKPVAAGQSGSAMAGVEKELKALSEKGSTYGKAFATNFSKGLNGATVSVATWLTSKVYTPMGNAATSANHFGYAFSYGFVSGLNTAPINVVTWLSEKVYGPMGNAAVSANHFGYAFSYGFVQGMNTSPINVTGWLSEKVYMPMGNAATSANHFGYAFAYGFAEGLNTAPITVTNWLLEKVYAPLGNAALGAKHYGYAFAYGFMNGLSTSPLTMDAWISKELYQPLNSAAAGARPYGSALVYNFKEGIKAIPVGMSVWLGNHVESPMREFVPKAYGWGSGMIGYFVTGMNKKGSNVTETARDLAKRVEEAFRSELGIHSPSRVMADLGYWSAMGVVKGFSGVDVSNIAKNKASELMAAFSGNYSGGGAAMAQQAIMQALMMTGKPMSLLNPMMKIAEKESGFNPMAINDWDINAQRGDPSIGLFQIIGETFKRWKLPGFDDRTNPLDSALAAIRYMDGRYGGIMNHPGIKSMQKGGGYKPYAKGGVITSEHIARVGEKNKKEVIIPLEQHRNRAMGLLDYAQNALGVTPEPTVQLAAGESPVTLPKEDVSTVQSVMSKTVQTVKSGVRDVIVQITGASHYSNDMDAEKVGKIAVQAVETHLENEYFATGGLAVDG
ncbi:phage tail tape measure protein [Domibacillus tundrae]|uniref:phage tail tape measure protein n=1 Tax=Domibacillus tundrae TaxID=1587527 RepID=UPI000617FAF0|nr:phage tail tape measure protein [Domibacillus tundrae]